MMYLYIQAPFAACRTFTAGWYRPTATFLTPSAAYGLILNVAGVETRLREEDERHGGKVPASLTRPGLPAVRWRRGALRGGGGSEPYPHVHTVYQQLHNYPVGAFWEGAGRVGTEISTMSLRFAVNSFPNYATVVALDGNPDLEDQRPPRLTRRLQRRPLRPAVSRRQRFSSRPAGGIERRARAHWYERVTEASPDGPRPRTTRLTILIDRAELSRTTSALFAPTKDSSSVIPEIGLDGNSAAGGTAP